MAKQTFTTGQVLTAAQMTSLQQTAMGGGSATAKTASYVLVAADAGSTVIMNSGSSTTITVNTALFAAGDTVLIVNQGAGVCTVTAGTATVNTAGSLALSQYETSILYFLSTSAAILTDYTQSGGMTNPMTTTGDTIYSSSGSTPARLGIGTTGQVLTVAAGLPSWATPTSTPTFVGCSLTQSANSQSISNATWTATTFDTEVLDTNAFHSLVTNTSRITIPTGYAGKYQINYGVSFGTASATGARYGQIYKNGNSLTGTSSFATPTSTFAPGCNNSFITTLAEADYIEAMIYQSSGSSMNMDFPGQSFSVQYLGA